MSEGRVFVLFWLTYGVVVFGAGALFGLMWWGLSKWFGWGPFA